MADVKKVPVTMADHVSGLVRDPSDKTSYWFPVLVGVFFAFLLGFVCTIVYFLVCAFCQLFWLEHVTLFLTNQERMNQYSLNGLRALVIFAFVVMVFGWVNVGLERKREKMS